MSESLKEHHTLFRSLAEQNLDDNLESGIVFYVFLISMKPCLSSYSSSSFPFWLLNSPIPRMEDAAFQKKSLPKIYKLKDKKQTELEALAQTHFQCASVQVSPSHLHISRRRWKTSIMLQALFEDGNPVRGLSFTSDIPQLFLANRNILSVNHASCCFLI